MADILTPALGESVTEATIGKWTKKAGDAVKKDEVLVELETDKVSLEVVSPSDGVLSEIKAPDGATVTPGAVLGVVTEGASAAAAAEAPRAEAKAAPAPKAESAPAPAAAPAAEPAPAAPAAAGGSVAIMTPTMGESVAEGTMGTWLKKAGDTVARDEMLVEIETDKVAVEVSAPAAGVLTILADTGSTVTPGQQIGSIAASGEVPAAAPA
ncbi:MAG: dihydrolipoamide succinyltransferase, partial [Alphaproteobacteria bacterium]|nr:dihydrolipoamide succinyltransferase [Alphaproteobacteria bacterium]